MVRIYVLFHDGAFRDVYASFSAAMRDKHIGSCCDIRTFDREDY
jgi:hypothetical protein